MNTSNEICKGCVNVSLDRNEWPCLDCCEGDRYNEPQPEADRPMQIPAVIGCDSGWIKCSDRLPESGKHVIGCIKDYYGEYSVTQVFYVDRWYDIVMGNDTIDVTHWMPLPEPPNHGQ